MKILKIVGLSIAFASLAGCQSGHELDYSTVSQIQRNITTEQQIRTTFGEPIAVHINSQKGTKTLTYQYKDSDELKKAGVGVLGAVAGGVLGYQFGGGFGRTLTTTAGAAAGGLLAGNAVDARTKTQTLTVVISLATDRVVDYYYNQDQTRTQSSRPSTGPGAL